MIDATGAYRIDGVPIGSVVVRVEVPPLGWQHWSVAMNGSADGVIPTGGIGRTTPSMRSPVTTA